MSIFRAPPPRYFSPSLNCRSPAPPAIALVGLLGMQLGEQLFPLGRDLLQQWLH
ncbi:hypothetical protein AO969_22575 [Pseudomonas aeruginosa]|nr:hypothetical protein AO969_22575 [Pseudomonas aeruginosa]